MFEVAELGSKVAKDAYEARVPQLRVDLLNAQYDLRKADFSVLVILAGDDRAGINDLLHTLHEWLDARYLNTRAFRAPTPSETERPPMWRYWRELPPAGRIGVFLGGPLQSAIAARVRGEIDDAELERRAESTAQAERWLDDDGTLVLKFWLHLPDRQRRKRARAGRLRGERDEDRDWDIFDPANGGLVAAERALQATSETQPWHLVESVDVRHRNLAVADALLQALERRLAAPAPPPSTPLDVARPARTVLDTVDLSRELRRGEYARERDALQETLAAQVADLRRSGRSAVLVFEGWDAAGKGGVIRRLTRALDPRDYRLVPIGAPDATERAHHYLWRFWRELPPAGTLLVFDRSWYGRVLVERVEGLAGPAEWRRAYAEINAFEDQLLDHGLGLAKFWLHIDADEQLRRFRAREATPYKKYKLTPEDYRNRERWDDYVVAVHDMVGQTSREGAPWHLIPANDKRWARVEVLRHTCALLERTLAG